MRVSGFLTGMLSVDATLAEDFNRWYDMDHMPEHLAKPDVAAGRRYARVPELSDGGDVSFGAPIDSYPGYLTTYLLGGDEDFMSEARRAAWGELDRTITKSGRYWKRGEQAFVQRWRLSRARATAGVYVSEPAVPYLAHRGLILILGRCAGGQRRGQALTWWNEIHEPDLLAVPGVVALLRGEPADGDPDLLIHLVLCEDSVRAVVPQVARLRRRLEITGRYPPYDESYVDIAFLPYERIVPLDYPATR